MQHTSLWDLPLNNHIAFSPPYRSPQRDGSCLADTSVGAWDDSSAATPIPWVSCSKPTQRPDRWAPFMMRQETLAEYKSPPRIRLPKSTRNGSGRDTQNPAFKTSVVNVNGPNSCKRRQTGLFLQFGLTFFFSFPAEINCDIWQPLKCITCLCNDLLIEFLWIITTTNIYWALTTCQATNTCLCHLILISTLWNRFLD